MTIKGRVGLFARDYNLQIKILPHLTSSLPVLVGLASGPITGGISIIAGAATWLADKIFSPEIGKIAASNYTLTGTWQKPVWKEVTEEKQSKPPAGGLPTPFTNQ